MLCILCASSVLTSLHPQLIGKEAEVQRQQETCPRSHTEEVMEPGFRGTTLWLLTSHSSSAPGASLALVLDPVPWSVTVFRRKKPERVYTLKGKSQQGRRSVSLHDNNSWHLLSAAVCQELC